MKSFQKRMLFWLNLFLIWVIPVTLLAQRGIVFGEQDAEIIKQLQTLEDVSVQKVDLTLTVVQPIDHQNPENGTFNQRVYLTHRGFNRPMVLWLEGYAARGPQIQELTRLLDANQLVVEHRYFGHSRPDSLDWRYLNIRQAAADHHRIVELFKQLYKGKWISSGISKGGQTTMYHRRFYPDDVDASVCYVAPLNFSDKEPRLIRFFHQVGTPECRQKIKQFQKLALSRKEELLPEFKRYAKNRGLSFKIGPEAAFEYCVLEYEFSFWQWHKATCEEIPDSTATWQEIFDHLVKVSDPRFFSDAGIAELQPFFYQALTEIGFYTYDVTPLAGLLKVVKRPDFHFCLPEGVNAVFDPKPMQDIKRWLDEEGERMIFIYGGLDPWSAGTGVELSGQTDALKMVLKNGDHRTRISSFPPEDQEKIRSTLERWLDMKIPRRHKD